MLRQLSAAPCRASGASATGRILGPAPCGTARCAARTLPCGPVGHAAPGPPWWPYLPQRWRGQPGPQQSDRQCMGLLHLAALSFEGGPWPFRRGTLRDAPGLGSSAAARRLAICLPRRRGPAKRSSGQQPRDLLSIVGRVGAQPGNASCYVCQGETTAGRGGAAGPPATRLWHPAPLSQALVAGAAGAACTLAYKAGVFSTLRSPAIFYAHAHAMYRLYISCAPLAGANVPTHPIVTAV